LNTLSKSDSKLSVLNLLVTWDQFSYNPTQTLLFVYDIYYMNLSKLEYRRADVDVS